jgi:YggT family protein
MERMRAILDVVLIVIQLYTWVVIASVIFSWLVGFNIVNMRNQVVATIGEALYRMTEPVLGPIRRAMPAFGTLDLSPIVLLLLLFLLERVIIYYVYPNVF